MTTMQLTTSDGHVLAADLEHARAGASPIGGVVLCHPHPQYGGNRFNTVVAALYDALPGAGYVTLRFDFRRQFGGGVEERLDVIAALDRLDTIAVLADRPRFVVGYSFGAVVALNTPDERVAAVCAIAPPLAMMDVREPDVPTLVLTPRHDQFSPPESTEAIVAGWTDADVDVIESTDHFLAGRATTVASQVTSWLDRCSR